MFLSLNRPQSILYTITLSWNENRADWLVLCARTLWRAMLSQEQEHHAMFFVKVLTHSEIENVLCSYHCFERPGGFHYTSVQRKKEDKRQVRGKPAIMLPENTKKQETTGRGKLKKSQCTKKQRVTCPLEDHGRMRDKSYYLSQNIHSMRATRTSRQINQNHLSERKSLKGLKLQIRNLFGKPPVSLRSAV